VQDVRLVQCHVGSWDNTVGIATGYMLDGQRVGVRVPVCQDFLLSTSSGPVLGPTQPPKQWVQGALSPGVRRPGFEADHSPPTSVEVKNTWIYTSISPTSLYGAVLN
jgi:hypothetical protein